VLQVSGDGEHRKTVLPNGIRLVSEQMPHVRSVAVGVWVETGSRHEPGARAGVSHFIEHLVFKGTESRTAEEVARAVDSVGGQMDAFTTKEHTCFYVTVLDRHLPLAADLLSDILLHPLFAADDIEREKSVVLQEFRMVEDTPDDLIHDLFTETLWPNHPLGRPILGTKKSIRAATRDQVRRYWRKHYVPRNIVVVAVGNLQHEQVLELLASGMETGTVRSEGPVAWKVREAGRAPESSGRTLVKRRDTEQAHICIGTTGLSRNDDDRFAFGVVNNAIGGGMSSRLFQEVREKRGLAYSVYSYHSMYADAGIFAAYAGTTPARTKQVMSIVRAQLEDVAEKGLSPDEFDRAKGHMRGSLVLSQEDPGGRMSRLGKSEISQGEILTVNQLLSRIAAVTPDDAMRAAERVLSQPMTTTVLGPVDGSIGRAAR
jgi:predicted Zn-dependent peptidase